MGLKKGINPFGMIAIGSAGIIGTSWIYTNSKFFTLYGSGGEIFGILLATIFVAVVAAAYAELASTFPRAGGVVVYGYVAFNKTTAFIAGWMLLGAYLASLAFYVMASGMLLSWIFPQLRVINLYSISGTHVFLPVLLIGIIFTILLFLLNYRGVRLSSYVQMILFLAILALGFVLCLVGFSYGNISNFYPPYPEGSSPILLTLRFMLPAMTFLTGFEMVAVMSEEANTSPRNIGRIVVLSVLIAGSFYSLVLLSSAFVLPWEETAQLEKGTIDAFIKAGFPTLGWSAYAISFIGLITSFLALFMVTPRVILSMGRAGLLPEFFTKTHPIYGTPTYALLFTLVLSLALGLLGEAATTWFLDLGGIFIGIAWIIGILSMLRIEKRYPEIERAYRVPARYALGAVGIFMISLILILSLLPGNELSLIWPYEYGVLMAWLILGLIIYKSTPKHKSRDEALKDLLGNYYEKIKEKN